MTPIDLAMTPLLNGIWQGVILAAAMWLLLKLFPRLNATTRFTALWLTLCAVAVMPFGLLMSQASLLRSQADSLAIRATNTPATTAFFPVRTRPPEGKTGPSPDSPLESIPPKPKSISERGSPTGPVRVPVRNAASRSSWPVMGVVEHPGIQIRSRKVLGGFETLWAFLALLLLARLGAGYGELQRLKSSATPALEDRQVQLLSLCAMNGIRRQTRLLVSSQIMAPMSLGFLHPAILIPRALLDTLSDSELEHILLHELAHLRRRDDWTNLAQKLMEAVLPIQPAVYWIGRRMSLEREMACDDWVIAATGTARPYAASLTKVAELSRWQHAATLAAGAAGNRSQLFRRVHHMLDRSRNATPKVALGPLAIGLAAIVALMYAGARTPQMIAFAQNPSGENSQETRTAPKTPQAPPSLQAPLGPAAPITPASPLMPQSTLTPPTRLARQGPEAPASPLAPTAPLAPSSPLAPKAPLAPMAPVASQQNGETHVERTTRNGWTSLDLRIDGTIEFTDDDHDVKSLSPHGHFRLEEGTWLSKRVYDVKADSAGHLTKMYSVGWAAKPLDDEWRAWLGSLLPQLIRDSGIGAGPRVARILRQGGPQAVLAEIGLIHSDGSRRVYLEQLLSQATLNTTQLTEAAKLIREISSDGDKAQVIVTVDEKYFTAELRPDLFEAAESIRSDGDKRRVLSDFVKKDAASADTLVSTAKAAEHISSDGDKAEVLIEMAEPYSAGDTFRGTYFDAVNSISSDGDHARVLSELLERHGDDRDTLARVLRSAERISSDGDKARVLEEAVSRYGEDELVRKAFFEAANSISGDGDHQRVLVALVHRQGIGTATLGGIAGSAERISSDGDKARVLVELAGASVEPIRDAFLSAADSIHSDGDHSRVLIALLDQPGTSSAMAVRAIQSATSISSDGDLGRVLLAAADRYAKDPAVNRALRQAVANLHSDSEYRAVMSEIARREGST
jgi:beta-lactamase regulating signal transducer with metallopeptidase domain